MEIKTEDMDEILTAHLQKVNKIGVYQPRVIANSINGNVAFKATWSWWAFIASWAFFLYRKMYLPAILFFIATVFSFMIPIFGGLVVMITSGICAYFLYTKKLYKDLEIAGYGEKSLDEVKSNLYQLGGYNSWVVWVAVIFYGLIGLLLILGLGATAMGL